MDLSTLYWIYAFVLFFAFTIIKYPLAYISLVLQFAEDLIRLYNKIVDLRLSRQARKGAKLLIEIVDNSSGLKIQSTKKYEKLLTEMIGPENLKKHKDGHINFGGHEDEIYEYIFTFYKELYKDDYMDYEDWAGDILKDK